MMGRSQNLYCRDYRFRRAPGHQREIVAASLKRKCSYLPPIEKAALVIIFVYPRMGYSFS
jgi:hypothetical protein